MLSASFFISTDPNAPRSFEYIELLLGLFLKIKKAKSPSYPIIKYLGSNS